MINVHKPECPLMKLQLKVHVHCRLNEKNTKLVHLNSKARFILPANAIQMLTPLGCFHSTSQCQVNCCECVTSHFVLHIIAMNQALFRCYLHNILINYKKQMQKFSRLEMSWNNDSTCMLYTVTIFLLSADCARKHIYCSQYKLHTVHCAQYEPQLQPTCTLDHRPSSLMCIQSYSQPLNRY